MLALTALGALVLALRPAGNPANPANQGRGSAAFDASASARGGEPGAIHGWRAELPADPWGAGAQAWLFPLRSDEAGQAAYAKRLRERFDLPPGAPWRLLLPALPGAALPGAATGSPPQLSPRVQDADGAPALVPFPVPDSARSDPLARALARPMAQPMAAGGPEGSAASAGLLWGRMPTAPRLVLAGEPLELVRAAFAADASDGSAGLATRSAESAHRAVAALQDPASLWEENERLRQALAQERARRQERERAWYDFNRTLAELRVTPDEVRFDVDEELVPQAKEDRLAAERRAEELLEEASSEASDEEPANEDAALERHAAIQRSLEAFLILADLQSYDLLELGALQSDAPLGGIGPVVFRILDDRGRLAGGLHAELLRFEGSRSGRTVTLVLEDGYESHGGVRTPFAGGMRRIPVPFLDPEPWVEALPELFPPGAFADVEDDGRWDREDVRRRMNDLLADDTSLGWYRVRGIGGVIGSMLTDLHLEVLDASGRLTRRLFADRARIEVEPPGMVLRLENGVLLRGDTKEAFRNGSYDVYLPRARPEEWRAARLPGLVSEPEGTAGEAPSGE